MIYFILSHRIASHRSYHHHHHYHHLPIIIRYHHWSPSLPRCLVYIHWQGVLQSIMVESTPIHPLSFSPQSPPPSSPPSSSSSPAFLHDHPTDSKCRACPVSSLANRQRLARTSTPWRMLDVKAIGLKSLRSWRKSPNMLPRGNVCIIIHTSYRSTWNVHHSCR